MGGQGRAHAPVAHALACRSFVLDDRKMAPPVELWPLFGLVIETPRLQLRLPSEDHLIVLATAARSIRAVDERPFQMAWMYDATPQMERRMLQRHWRALAHWRPESWHLSLAVYRDGRPIGAQDLWANDFATARSVGTGSWITRDCQRRGYGTEARAAVLELAFGCLGARRAHSEHLDGNVAAARVSERLGYTCGERRAVEREGHGMVVEQQMILEREAWALARDRPSCAVRGIAGCWELFGIPASVAGSEQSV